MAHYVASRAGQAVLTIFGIATLLFIVLRLSGDPVSLLLPQDAPAHSRTALRHELGLDAPVGVQYARFLSRLFMLDFGDSLRLRRPALPLVMSRLPATLVLAAAAILLSLVLGLAAGIYAAARPHSWLSGVVMLLSVVGQAMPVYWSGIVMLLIFAVELHWLPVFGYGGWQHLILPAVSLAGWPLAKITRLTRVGMAEVLHEDYVRTARAKGMRESRVLWKHALHNTVVSILTVAGIEISQMIGGAVVTETIFSWPGLGRTLMEGVLSRDYPLVQATVFIVALAVVLINFMVDLGYAQADPRIRTT